jgi:hypothetical protein
MITSIGSGEPAWMSIGLIDYRMATYVDTASVDLPGIMAGRIMIYEDIESAQASYNTWLSYNMLQQVVTHTENGTIGDQYTLHIMAQGSMAGALRSIGRVCRAVYVYDNTYLFANGKTTSETVDSHEWVNLSVNTANTLRTMVCD